MNAHFVPTSFRCLHGFLILAIVVVLFDPLRAAQELYTNTYSWSYSSVPGYGEVVATNRDTVLIGNHQSSSASASNLRDVTELARGGSGWILQQTFQVPNWGVFQASGDTLAAGDTLFARAGGSWAAQGVIPEAKEAVAVALQGDTVVYGIPVHSLAPGAFQTDGSVIICQRSGTAWSKQATLVPSQSYQRFGTAVALDGDTLLAATGDGSAPGRVYAYRRSGSSWSLEGSLGFPDQGDWPRLAIEGDTAVVGDGSKDRVGIFTRSGTTWSLQQTIAYAPSNPNGYVLDVRVALKNGVLAVATEGDAKVYLYTRTSSGWLLVQTVSGSFAALHALTETGDALVVGDPDNRLARMSFTPRPPAPGSGWRDYDVGAVGGAGSSSDDGTTVTVRGSGPDIWDRLDQFHFRSETMTGDGAIVARVTSAGTTHPWAKVGLMFRENVASASREVTAFVTPGAHVGTAVRASPADYTAFQDAGWSGAPIWLMLARSGNLFASYRSDDGDHWTPMGSATVSMPATIHVGLAVASHYAGGELNIGTFTNVELVGLPPPPNDPPAAPTNLQAGNQTATTAALSWTDNSNDETGFEIQRATGDGSGTFTVVTTTAANASSYIDSGLTADTQYTYRVRAVRNGTFSANSNTFTVRTLTNTNTGWASADIGNVGVAGSTSASGAAVTLNAGGEDIWNQADGFRFYYSRWSGDGSVTAHVSALTNTHPWAKAGVMIRESLNAGAAHATMVLTADNVCGFITRSSAGAAAEFIGGPWLNAPYWVRVTRSGNLFSGYISPDGLTWTLVGSKTMAMGSPVYVGVAGSSHNVGAQTTISFDNISASGPTSTPPAAPSDLHATNITANGAHLTWTDNSNNEDGFRIYAEDDTPQAGFQRVGATAANATSLDVGLQSSRHYYIIVASFRGTTETWSDAITVTTPPSPDTPPPAPPHIAVDPDASNSLRVAWDDVSTTETGFEIERASGGGAFALVGSSGANVAYYSDAGLTAGTGYSYRVRAMNGSSASGYSPVGTATAVAAPTAPSGLVVDGPTDTTLHLSWTDRSNDERGFELMRATGNGTFDKQILLAANTTSYTDTGLTPGTTYSYKVQASAYFTSGYSNTVTGSTAGGPPPPPPGSWTGYDIGNTGSSGSDSGSAPTVTMNAGGADIYGTADGFHGLFSSAEGDVTVIARVASMTNTHPWAKAGVMIRASLSPDAPNAAMLLTADIVCVFQARTTAGGDTASTSGGYFNAPYWVKLTRTGNTFAGFISADGLTWTQVGSQDIAMSGTIYVGVAGSSHNVGAQTTIAFDHLTVTTSSAPPPPPPASWSQQAWSASGSSVTVAASGDAIVLAGASADLWENSDGGTFAYHASTGDALIEARVDSLTRADSYSKAGLMFRATAPNPYSANACVVVTPEHGIIFQARQTDGSATIAVREVGGVQAPVWLRLGRAGNDFIAAYSLDEGVTWTTLGTVTVTMPATVSVGVVATSHNSSASSTASFSHIQN